VSLAARERLISARESAGAGLIESRLRALYGAVPDAPGVVHVTAVWCPAAGPPRVLRINEATPKSDTDFFVLNATRARADAILTTGRILREEPGVSHALQGPDAKALEDWRTRTLGKTEPPLTLVLSSGRDLDLDAALLQGPGKVVLFTGAEAAARLAPAAQGRALKIVSDPTPSIRSAIQWLRGQGARTISIEAGPSSARELYAVPVLVDELLLSIFEGRQLPEGVEGPEFLPLEKLREMLPHATPPVRIEEPSGPWSFQRLARRALG
jgi:riboflavin biosynthesis pyrimidine reductase